ncbi:hypothetical protein PMG11_04059 [Penicillium brasilianum]|uniref:Uncharacterized protein n=1 Tax=Penicillium brasilianum TaxID=104259 RepID=A0A0F7VBM9_PENBI|nr:hypothetical protein PMG11_04059 [Penicillium brasilianum]
MEVLLVANLEAQAQRTEAAEILEHEFTVIASILDDRSGPELATDRERDLASELQEYAEEKIVINPKTPSEVDVPKKGCKILIRGLVFDCWMFCGMSNAWDWRSEDIWNAFEEFRKNDPIYELSKTICTTPENALLFKPPSWGAHRPWVKN